MAAICGKLSVKETVTKSEILSSLDSMSLRGGSTQETHLIKNFGMGCTRTNSSSDGGLFHSEDQKVWIAYDGKIFNVYQLIKEHQSANIGGLAILPWLYQRYGLDFVEKLDGSFSLIVWDDTKNVVLLARDHIGSKPLFYSFQSGNLVFASQIDGLSSFTSVKRTLSVESLDCYLTYLYVPAPNTLFKEIKQVAPAQVCRFCNSDVITKNFYPCEPPSRFRQDDPSSWSITLRELLTQSIQLSVGGKGSVGFLLSGGTDTAALLGCASSFLPHPIKTFTLGFPDCSYVDERKDARKTAQYFQTDHTELEVNHTCIEALREVTRYCGTPVGNPASLISFSLFRGIRSFVDTVVCGDGGNEIFGGVYKYHQAMNFVANLKDDRMLKRIVQTYGQKLWCRLRETKLESLLQKFYAVYSERVGTSNALCDIQLDEIQFHKVVTFYCLLESVWAMSNKGSLYTTDVREKLAGYDSLEFLRKFFVHEDDSPVLQQLIYARTNSFIPNNAIPYVEFNALANGVFPLFPLLAKKLLAFMYKVPFEHVYGKSFRYFMEQALANQVIPAEIFRRPVKGFNTPINHWLGTVKWREIVYDYLSRDRVKKRGLFSPDYVHRLVQDYYSGRKFITTEHSGKVQPLGLSIWSLVALEAWCQEYL